MSRPWLLLAALIPAKVGGAKGSRFTPSPFWNRPDLEREKGG